ncbi:hypothetical protein PWT90_10461 [Aphanocladium album]|nr:hypothetical protein PWT90_10461 [Aphanocladium album]
MPPIVFGARRPTELSDANMGHLIDVQTLITFMALIPIIAYPFLPSVGRSGVRCEIFFIWSCSVGFTLVKMAAYMQTDSDGPKLSIARWQALLFTLPMVAGVLGLRVPCIRKANAKDFSYLAGFLQTSGLFWGFDLAEKTLYPQQGVLGWQLYILRLLGIILFLITVGAAAYTIVEHYVPVVVCHFITRHVSWWFWLPENGADEDFGPAWSIALAITVGAAPVLIFAIISYSIKFGTIG